MKSSVERAVGDLAQRLRGDSSPRQVLVTIVTVMIVVQLLFRSWAIYGGWFYGDDLKFLSEAATQPLTIEYLFTRHQQQLMPGGLLVSWLVGQGPAYSWPLAATTILVMQALASAACVTALVRLFGWRPGILIPLGLYLYGPLTLGAYMWWAAALNQLPLQIVFFATIATHVTYVRTHRVRWAAASSGLLVVGLLFYVKAVIVVPLLVLLTLTHLVAGRPSTRVVVALRRFWPVWTGYAVVAIGYLTAYASAGGSPVGTGGNAAYLETADRQVRQTLGSALTGGPWRWLYQGRQDVLADPPEFAVTAAWVVLAAVVVGTCWRRAGAWRAWALLAIYLVPTVYLTASGRTTLFGPDVGLYLRYTSDVAVVATLALALATMPLLGTEDIRLRTTQPQVSLRPAVVLGVIGFLVGATYSSATYVRFWQTESPTERYVIAAARDLAPLEGIEVVDEPVPEGFVLRPNAPYNRPSRLLAPLRKKLRPVTSGNDLRMFGTDGQLGPAVVTPGIMARIPTSSDCGVLVDSSTPVDIPLRSAVTDDRWWMSVSYLASADGTVRIGVGGRSETLPVTEGPHTLFLVTSGSYDEVAVQTLTPDLGICVDTITVGFIGTYS